MDNSFLFETVAVRRDGFWHVAVQSPVSDHIYQCSGTDLQKVLLLATEEAGEELLYVHSEVMTGREKLH